jgi:hypothetical protein
VCLRLLQRNGVKDSKVKYFELASQLQFNLQNTCKVCSNAARSPSGATRRRNMGSLYIHLESAGHAFIGKAKQLPLPWLVVLATSHLYNFAALFAVFASTESADGPTELTADSFAYRFPPVGGLTVVYELDLLVSSMLCLTLWHAALKGQHMLALAGLGLGFVTETLSLRFGGTHCHASGLLDFTPCSSLNSILYYTPWVYSCVSCARCLVADEASWTFPLVCGLLFFGMCGPYESQGPMMGWWLWPQADRVVKAGVDLWQFGAPGLDPRGLVAAEHAYEALATRAFGVPALAPYFHFAFGWGIATAFQAQTRWSLPGGAIAPVLLGPAFGMLWDPPVRLCDWLLGANKLAAAMSIMAVALALPFFAGKPLKSSQAFDPLLFASPALNGMFFVGNAIVGRGASTLPGELKLFVLCVASCATVAYARASGLFQVGEDGGSTKGDERFMV